jgi:hypothetical protein
VVFIHEHIKLLTILFAYPHRDYIVTQIFSHSSHDNSLSIKIALMMNDQIIVRGTIQALLLSAEKLVVAP